MNTFSHVNLLHSFQSSLLSSPFLGGYTLINQICCQSSDYGYCLETLRNNQTSPSTDFETLLVITVNRSVMLATDNEIFIQKSMAAEKDEHLKQLYAGGGDYQVVVNILQTAKHDCDNKDYSQILGLYQQCIRPYSQILGLYQQCIRPVINCQSVIADFVPQMLENNRLMRALISMGFYEGQQLLKILSEESFNK